jgi:leucyl/phenylalanyl-tRNA---protein transferase
MNFDPLDPVVIAMAYRRGYFPMPDPDTGEILWFDPEPRAIIPLDGLHVSRSLQKVIRRAQYLVTFDQDFESVVRLCADRKETWITEAFIDMYLRMFKLGLAHSIEIKGLQGQWIGGLFGLHFGAVFNGESMFSKAENGSKLALFHMVGHLKTCGFDIFEVQFMTKHLSSMGAVTLSRDDYHLWQAQAVAKIVSFCSHLRAEKK